MLSEESKIPTEGVLDEYAQAVEEVGTANVVDATPRAESVGFLDEHPHLRASLVAGVVAAGLAASPPAVQEAEAGVLSRAVANAAEVSMFRAANKEVGKRLDYEKSARALEELKLSEAAAKKSYDTALSNFLAQDSSRNEGDFLRSQRGNELHNFLLVTMKSVSDYKEAHPYLKK